MSPAARKKHAFGISPRKDARYPKEDRFSVNYNFTPRTAGDYDPLWLRSSDLVSIAVGADFSDAVRSRIRARRRNGGAQKGRVLYIGRGSALLATLAYHVPATGPLEIQVLAASRELPEAMAFRFQRYLIECLREASEALGRPAGEVAWSTDRDETAKAASLPQFGFARAPKPRDCKLKHYLLRNDPSASKGPSRRP